MGEKSRGNFAPAQRISQERFEQIFKKNKSTKTDPIKPDKVQYEVSLCTEGVCNKTQKCPNCPLQVKEIKNKSSL